MTESPLVEIVILLFTLIALCYILVSEISSKKPRWGFRLSDFIVKHPANPDEKNGAVLIFGLVFIGIVLFLLFQRFSAIGW